MANKTTKELIHVSFKKVRKNDWREVSPERADAMVAEWTSAGWKVISRYSVERSVFVPDAADQGELDRNEYSWFDEKTGRVMHPACW